MAKQRERNALEKKYLWHIDEMYPTAEAFESQFEVAKGLMDKINTFKGRILSSQATLRDVMAAQEELTKLIENLFTYAHMKKDEDNGLSESQGRFERAMALSVEIGSVLSFVEPELLLGDEERVFSLIKGDAFLGQYNFYFEKLYRQKAHKLSEREEKLLAMNGEIAAAPQQIFSMLNNADLKFPVIENLEGEAVELTKGNFITFLESPSQDLRKRAYEAFYASYMSVKNTISASYISSVKKDIFYAKARQYESALKWGLDDERIDQSVYDNLIEAMHEKVDLMHRYMKLRKRMLGVEELHAYDLYAPLVNEDKQVIPYEKGVEMVVEGLSVLGDKYLGIMKEGLENGWVDVFETPGKTSGAYSWGTYDSKPYILLNYQENINYVFTLAHELGHSMHSYLSAQNQSHANAGYTIFVAEVASTVNESLLMQSLLEKTKEKKARMSLLNHFLDQFKSTVYRQTMFAEFEKWTHEQIEAGNPLTQEDISTYYLNLNAFYFGDTVILDDALRYEWMRIPHFYNAYYVYKYATGFSAAMAISERITRLGQPAVDDYLKFLSSGGSDYPIELLKIAGVDMTGPEAIKNGLNLFETLLDEMEALLDQ